MDRETTIEYMRKAVACHNENPADCHGRNCCDCSHDYPVETIELIESALELLEQDRWIPVTERMPEENIPILLGVRFKDDFKYFVTTRVDYNYWTGLGRDIRGKLAWMPLPEPWRGEKDD